MRIPVQNDPTPVLAAGAGLVLTRGGTGAIVVTVVDRVRCRSCAHDNESVVVQHARIIMRFFIIALLPMLKVFIFRGPRTCPP